MKKSRFVFIAVAIVAAYSLFFAPLTKISAQSGIVASYKFNPKVDGYGFENFGNDDRDWEDDLGADDLIRMFGAKAVCKTGADAKSCVMKAAAKEWIRQELEGMNGGHCEGMAATSLRMNTGLPFKGKTFAADFQAGAKSPFGLKLDQTIENHIAYYFVTQGFDDVAEPSQKTAQAGPIALVKMLIDNMKAGNDTYSLGFYKFKDGRKSDGHAITPFAVEDAGDVYRIHVYDNNYPGETRYVVVEKGGKQTWRYVTSTNPNEPAGEYVGNLDTKTLELTSTAVRDKGCFSAPFASEADQAACVPVIEKPVARPANKPSDKPAVEEEGGDDAGEMVEFSVNGEADLLVTTDKGKRIGYDPKTNKFYNEIAGADDGLVKGGMGVNMPQYSVPLDPSVKSYTLVFSGKQNTAETDVDFVYSAPGLTVGFDSMRIDPNETLTATISADGENISFTASADGETPEIYFAFDGEDGESYVVEVDGASLDGGKTLTATFDDETGKLSFKDNDGNSDKFDVDFTRFDAKGAKQTAELNDVGAADAGADNYELEFDEWDGEEGKIPVKHDEEGNGFADDEEEEVESEDNDDDPDDADDNADDEDSDIDDDGQLNDADADDDGDGTSDDKDTDDDGDGESDATDDDDNEDGEDGDGSMNFLARLFAF